jgi:hypothetical protein
MSREPLAETAKMLEQTASIVQALLALKFPASGGHPYPDACGNVCVAERHGSDRQTAALAYAASVTRLAKLVGTLRNAALMEANRAQTFLARMMPGEPAPHRQDDATASCIWLLLWNLHAWVLELRLTLVLADEPEPGVLRDLDARLEKLLEAGDLWLEIEMCGAARQLCVACAPAESVPVKALAWPNLLGARLASGNAAVRAAQARGIRVSLDEEGAWLRLGNRFAEIPINVSPAIMGAATRATVLVGSSGQPGRWAG